MALTIATQTFSASLTQTSFLPTFQSSSLTASAGSRSFLSIKGSVRCQAGDERNPESGSAGPSRRQALVGFGSASLAASVWVPTDADVARAADLVQRIQRGNFLSKVQAELRTATRANPELVPLVLRLGLHDAFTYDKATKTGGANGSIRFSEELSRPENAGLDKAVAFLTNVKEAIDSSQPKGGPIGWADLIQFGAQAAAKQIFLESAIAKAGGDVDKGILISTSFGSGAQWGFFEKQFGRADATEADPPGRVPLWDSLSAQEIKEKFAEKGIKVYQLVSLAAFLGPDVASIEAKLEQDPELAPYVKKYRNSRKTVSATDYEVDLITTYTKIAQLGAPINTEAYTYAPPKVQFKF